MNQRLRAGEAVDALRAAGIHIVREHTGDGSEVQCRCPNHPDPDGHLYVNAATGAAFCHRCKHSTNLAALCGHERKVVSAEELVRQNVLAVTAAYYHSRLFAAQAGPQARRALRYLTDERALPLEIVKRFQAGWAEGGLMRHLLDEKGFSLDACLNAVVLKRHDDGQVRDFFYRRIVFPNVVGGRVVHLSARIIGDGKPKWLHLPGEIVHPFNADALRHPGSLWLEGIFDVLSAEAWGHHAAAGLGTHHKPAWFANLSPDHRMIVCLDGDAVGESGAMKVAGTLGLRARIATLPPGKDPNDFLREGRRDEFEACLNGAQDLVTLQINRIPAEVAKTELRERLDQTLAKLATVDPATGEAYLRLIKDRFGLNRDEVSAYRKVLADLRRDNQQLAAASKPIGEVKYMALFDGLVDLVELDGQPAFLVRDEAELSVVRTVDRDGEVLAPPPPDKIPWLLPSAEEVLRTHREDNDAALYDDLVSYFTSVSELPTDAHYHLLAAWTLHTYLLEAFRYSPYIWLYAVPERGKTRTGAAMTHVAYRGIHVESLRDAYLVRIAEDLRATVFFDVMDIWRKAEKLGTEDILLNRFEKGLKVPRVLYPDRGAHRDMVYYSVFGATVIGTNESVHPILASRAVTINMPEARRRFEDDVTPERARPLRERLVAFRARHMDLPMPQVTKPASGRLGDMLRPLVQIVRLARPDREQTLRTLVGELEAARLTEKADSFESEILGIVESLRDELADGLLPVKRITDILNEVRPEKRKLSYRRVGGRLAALGFAKKKQASGACIRWDEEHLARVMTAHGLREPSQPSQTSAAQSLEHAGSLGDDDGNDGNDVSAPPTLPFRAHTLPARVSEWPPDAQAAYEAERTNLMSEGEVSEAIAMRLAEEHVHRVFGAAELKENEASPPGAGQGPRPGDQPR